MSKTSIPENILNEFIESKINYKEFGKVVDIRDSLLWDKDGLERHRINVWTEHHVDKWDIDIKKIGYSFFVSFDRKTKELVNKTILN